jgi:hypothetical protein
VEATKLSTKDEAGLPRPRNVGGAATTRTYSVAEVAGFIKYDGPSVSVKDMKRAVDENIGTCDGLKAGSVRQQDS